MDKKKSITCTRKKDGITAETTAHLQINNIWKLHGLSLSPISDQDYHFI